jgi:hypothetical protein
VTVNPFEHGHIIARSADIPAALAAIPASRAN